MEYGRREESYRGKKAEKGSVKWGTTLKGKRERERERQRQTGREREWGEGEG